jgi:hypothetical protein
MISFAPIEYDHLCSILLYIASWLKVLKDDKKAIFTAASHAQKAADYLLSLQPAPAPGPEPETGGDIPPPPDAAPTAGDSSPASGPPVPDGLPLGRPGQLSFF